ncbi:hypothetical protein BOTBODRAFT_180405 [Botryobasidium botryosum FD-172 SS1]|uniref:Exonuclease domain-containing protein n=1 Tax=Botryobasidium botryosum (strain FD-172 SS1) TaxID=930990 RepID=A0A067LZP4_BOTB1|nr:hypothetical protein BOTBODRAFT_180405 [Botryobasidium botryosum FD-172 SS1]
MQSSSSTTTSPPKPLRHILVLDFEATCDERNAPRPTEIIEFPTLLYDLETNEVQARFHEYVRPTRHPTLTAFCTKLTGIEQATVDKADPFHLVFARFQKWLAENTSLDDPATFAFLTCGDWDFKTMFPLQLATSSEDDPPLASIDTTPYKRWINVKTAYGRYYNTKKAGGMVGLLRNLGLELEGRHHSGIDDCENIARIVKRMRGDGWTPEAADFSYPRKDR